MDSNNAYAKIPSFYFASPSSYSQDAASRII